MTSTAPSPVSLAEASRFWLHLGLMHRELVERRRWLSERRYLHAFNYCMVLPGPEAIQLATYLGWLMHGIPGGLIAGGLFLAPSILVLLTLSTIYAVGGQLPILVAVFWALKPAGAGGGGPGRLGGPVRAQAALSPDRARSGAAGLGSGHPWRRCAAVPQQTTHFGGVAEVEQAHHQLRSEQRQWRSRPTGANHPSIAARSAPNSWWAPGRPAPTRLDLASSTVSLVLHWLSTPSALARMGAAAERRCRWTGV